MLAIVAPGQGAQTPGFLSPWLEDPALAERLREQKDAAEQANMAKSRFLAAASHDLRQPLQSLTLTAARWRACRWIVPAVPSRRRWRRTSRRTSGTMSTSE